MSHRKWELNRRSLRICEAMIAHPAEYRIRTAILGEGATIVDCGVEVPGSLAAGIALARICTGAVGHVSLGNAVHDVWPGPAVQFWTDQPVLACLGAQYGGWPIHLESYHAIASGPMRMCRGREPVLDHLRLVQPEKHAIGVLEAGQLPTEEVGQLVARECGISSFDLTLCVAPTTSLCGAIQVVSRSVESAMHKLHELKFDVHQVLSGWGTAPLPLPSGHWETAMGRVNDAIQYGAQVQLWLDSSDDELSQIAAKIPSNAGADYGRPFAEIFRACGHDFYKIDPMTFGPAEVCLHSLKSGNSFRAGKTRSDILHRSFCLNYEP